MWMDRLRDKVVYNSPSGVRLSADYEDVRQDVDKHTAAFNFADADGTYIQDSGHSGRRYPLRLFFWGDDYDLESETFLDALLERGTGRLEHPTYGTRDVVPFGTITRRDDLKTAANQAVFEVTFWETTGIIFPANQADPAASVLTAVDEYTAAASEEFADGVTLDTAIQRVSLKGAYETTLGTVSSVLRTVAAEQDNVRQQFDAIKDSITAGIDTLINDPLALAFQTILLVQTPALFAEGIKARLVAYSDLLDTITAGDGASPGADSPREINAFRSNDLYALGLVSGSIVSSVNAQFITKPEALEAAEKLLDELDQATLWREAAFTSFGGIDTGAAYQQLQEAAALAAGFLVEISFSLKQERRIVLDRARTIIDLSAELYGDIDSQLDFLITSNDLTGSEILELPKGREIVYYV
jgi:hypothetical protein